MGIGGIGLGELLIILVIVMLIFGTQRLKGIGADLGGAIKGFRSAMAEGERAVTPTEAPALGAAVGSGAKAIGDGSALADTPAATPAVAGRDSLRT
jgi:sec-independent protein translocase protein TatA